MSSHDIAAGTASAKASSGSASDLPPPSERGDELVERLKCLTNRLRGRYARGPILANGEPEFGWSTFDTLPNGEKFPSIYGEAADAAEQAASALLSAEAQITALKAELDEAQDDRDEYRDLLHDLVMIDAEAWAIGGGPGFADRREKAWSAARERFEP